jgi:glucose-6-phosphate 1-dehydrogenase
MVACSGTTSLKLKSMKRLNIKSLAICFNTDEDGFVKKMTYTPGNVHDSKEFDKLLGINKHKHKNKIKTCGEV